MDQLRLTLCEMATEDPGAVLEHLRGVMDVSERDELIRSIAVYLAQSDPIMADAFARALPSGERQQDAFLAIAAARFQQDADEALQWSKALPDGGVKLAVAESLAHALAVSDPARAATFAAESLHGADRVDALGHIVARWVQTNAQAALAWVGTLHETRVRKAAFVAAAAQLAETEPHAALKIVEDNVPSGEERNRLLRRIAQQWTRADFMSAAEQVETLPENMRTAFESGLVSTLAERSPAQAARYVATMESGPSQHEAASAVISAWSEADPAAAVQWASSFADDYLRENSLNIAVARWTAADPSSAATWIASLPAGPHTQQVLGASIVHLSAHAPELAPPLLNAVTNLEERHRLTEAVARAWIEVDASAAQQWLAMADLPKTRRDVLLADMSK